MFEDDGTIGALLGDGEEKSLFVDDDPKENAALDSDHTLIVESDFSPIKSAVKNRAKKIPVEIKRAPLVKNVIARKITKPAAKPSSYRVSETESEEAINPVAALKRRKTSAGNGKGKKHARHSSSEEQDEEAGGSLCESFKENHTRGEDDFKADSLADRIKRSRRHSRAMSSKEKTLLEVKDYEVSQKEKGKDNTINTGHDHAHYSKRNDDPMRSPTMAKVRSTTKANTVVNQPVIISSDFSSPKKRKRGAFEQHPTARKISGPRPKRTCATNATKDIGITPSTSVTKAKDGYQAAGTSKQPLEKATSAADAMTVQRALRTKAKPKHCTLLNPVFRPRLPVQKTHKTSSAPKALSQLKVTARRRKDSGVDMSPTTAGISTMTEYIARTDHVDKFEKQSGKHRGDYTDRKGLMRRGLMTAWVDEGGVTALRSVSPARSDLGIDWTSEELTALGVRPLRKPIPPPKLTKTLSFNPSKLHNLQPREAAPVIQCPVNSESGVPTVPSLSENKSTSEAETWIETPGHTSEDGTSANSQSAQDEPPANPQSALTTEDAQAAVILAHLAYRGVLGQRERAGIIEQAFNDAVQRIVMPRRWVFMNGALDGITDATPSNQLLIILESEVALIEAQYNIQRSRSQHFTPAHAIFWNQVLLPIKRFLSNYRTANMVITRHNAETILLALSREELVSQLDFIAQKNLQDSNREVIAAMGLLAMGKSV